MGGGAGAGGEGAEDPTDLDLAIRQVRGGRESLNVEYQCNSVFFLLFFSGVYIRDRRV